MYVDEHAFNPYRARVKAGTTVRWVNNGRILHTIAAEDGSWTSSRLVPLEADGHHVRQARRIHGHLQGPPVGEVAGHRRAVARSA